MPEANEHTQLKEAVLARNVRRACAMSHAHNQNSLDVVRAVLRKTGVVVRAPRAGRAVARGAATGAIKRGR